jgi:hypothetical protein
MPAPEAMFHAHLPLAEKIAGGYANIHGVSMDDAQAAL